MTATRTKSRVQGNETAERRVILPYPHTGQQTVQRQARRFNWLAAGRRWRKTTLFMSVAVQKALFGKQVLWGAPVYDQVRVGWLETKKALGSVANFNQGEMLCTLPTGGSIRYRSLDNPDNARGWTADLAILDEAAGIKEQAWYGVIRPMLLDTNGELWAGGTPEGQNYFWRECMSAQDNPESRFWNAPTLGAEIVDGQLLRRPHPLENPNIRWEELLSLFQTMPERLFRQEILAEFIEDAGGVFLGVSAVIDRGRRENEPPAVGRTYALGVDIARTQDFTVLTVIDSLGRQVYFERFNQVSWERVIARVVQVAQQYRAMVYLDSTGVGDPIYESLRKAGVPVDGVTFTNAEKERLIDGLAMGIEGRRIHLMDVPIQTAELQAFQYQLTPSRNVRMTAPEGMHDDTVIALALAWKGAARAPREAYAGRVPKQPAGYVRY